MTVASARVDGAAPNDEPLSYWGQSSSTGGDARRSDWADVETLQALAQVFLAVLGIFTGISLRRTYSFADSHFTTRYRAFKFYAVASWPKDMSDIRKPNAGHMPKTA